MDKTIKESGQVFTPANIVNHILNLCGYIPTNHILKRHVIDNSCGNGAILCEIVKRYCECFFNDSNDTQALKTELETYVHGIDNDINAVEECINNLNTTVLAYGLGGVEWNVFQGDSLVIDKFDNQMDYVIGNPPYVRIHNLTDSYETVKSYEFTQNGMADLYITFFEVGINMLNENGKLCYITPSSWTTSKAALKMREWLQTNDVLSAIVDMEHFNVFENFSVYTMITLLDKNHKTKQFDYYTYDSETDTINKKYELDIDRVSINNEFYFSSNETLGLLENVNFISENRQVFVKNGLATLLDKVFISDDLPFNEYTTKVLKASTGVWHKCFFPYDEHGNPINPTIIRENDNVMNYLEKHKDALTKRKSDKNILDWFYYGRSQGIKDVCRKRLGINTIIKDIDSLKLNIVPEGCCVYSGLYLYSDTVDIDTMIRILKTNEFIDYVKSLKKYKSGGFYTFSSKDLEKYVNYMITKWC